MRKQSEMLQLFPAYLKGEDLFGLTVSAVVRIAESVSILGDAGVSSPLCACCARWDRCTASRPSPDLGARALSVHLLSLRLSRHL